jgi:hypothetical protein
MGEIYSSAETVLVWLGLEAGKGILQAKSTMYILEYASEQESASPSKRWTDHAFRDALKAIQEPGSDVRSIIQDIWDRSYWTRL